MLKEILEIPKEIYNDILEHAQKENPIESCGYLAGKGNKIEKFYKMTNIDKSPEHFTFDPKEQFTTVKDARANGLQLISVYHSHPETPARLSEEDIRLFNDPNMIYSIVSLKEDTPDMQAYRLKKPSENEIEITRLELKVI